MPAQSEHPVSESNRFRSRPRGDLARSAEGVVGGGGYLGCVGRAEQAGVDQEGMELVEGHAGAPAVGQRDRLGVARRISSRCGAPKRASIARSVSRWPPCAAGSISAPRPSGQSTLPDQRSPWMRLGRLGRPAQLADLLDDGLHRPRVGRRQRARVPRPAQIRNEPSSGVPAPPVRFPMLSGGVLPSGAWPSRAVASGVLPSAAVSSGVLSSGVLSSGVLSSGSEAMYPGHGAPNAGAPAACIRASAAPSSPAGPGVGYRAAAAR